MSAPIIRTVVFTQTTARNSWEGADMPNLRGMVALSIRMFAVKHEILRLGVGDDIP